MWKSFSSLLHSCVSTPDADSDNSSERKCFDRTQCIFCDVSTENGFDVLWEDEHYIAFRDHNPSTKFHFLVIPKHHYESVKTLTASDVDMVQKLIAIGHTTLAEHGVEKDQRRLGFHIPPYTSVSHIHLHAQGLPFRSTFRKWKYPIAPGSKDNDKGLSWFVEADQAVQILTKGRKVAPDGPSADMLKYATLIFL